MAGEVNTSQADVESADSEITMLREQMSRDLDSVVNRMGATDARLDRIRRDTEELLQRAISQSRLVDAKLDERVAHDGRPSKRAVLDSIISLARANDPLEARHVVDLWGMRGSRPSAILPRLRELRTDGVLNWEGDHVGPSTVLRLTGTVPPISDPAPQPPPLDERPPVEPDSPGDIAEH